MERGDNDLCREEEIKIETHRNRISVDFEPAVMPSRAAGIYSVHVTFHVENFKSPQTLSRAFDFHLAAG